MTPPLFRWVGSKRAIAADIAERIRSKKVFMRNGHTWTYYEPFAGGASVFFALKPHRAVIADSNAELINFYQTIAEKPHGISEAYATWGKVNALLTFGTDRATFEAVRGMRCVDPTGRAARFLYLQATSFQGLWRENKAGEYNVPHGGRDSHMSYDWSPIRAASCYLGRAGVSIRLAHALEVLQEPRRGDVVYVDPPYVDTFGDYVAGGWSPLCAAAMVDQLWRLKSRGVTVIASDSDNAVTRYLYQGAQITRLRVRQSVAAKSQHRGHRRELLIQF